MNEREVPTRLSLSHPSVLFSSLLFSSLLFSSLSALHPVASFSAPLASSTSISASNLDSVSLLLSVTPLLSLSLLVRSALSHSLSFSFFLSFALDSNREQLGSSIGGRFSVRVPRFFRSVSSRELHARVLSQGLDSQVPVS